MRPHLRVAVAALLFACSHAAPAPRRAAASSREWIARSNQNAQILLDVQAQYAPEFAARTGVSGIDDRISDFNPGHRERLREGIRKALAILQERQHGERDPEVSQDLAILVDAAQRQIRGIELREKLEVPYTNLPRMIFGSIRALLDPQIAKERRPAALVRVRKYAGLEPGTTPAVQLVEAEIREGLAKGLLPPSRIEVENDLHTSKFLIDGIDKLFAQYGIAGYEQPVAALHQQLDQFLEFVRTEVLPKAREDFRLPPELYEFQLRQVGVDIPGEELAQRAHEGFTRIQSEMQVLAERIAKARGLTNWDYREVIKDLKKKQIPDDQVLAFYQRRLAQIEDIIREHRLVTLPERPARIRLGTPAENAQQPAPHMSPPRLIGNTGEQGEFVLPLSVPGKVEQKYDDFNYDAAAWTLTAHEARPGHELQFDGMVEHGVSLARAIFAFNSVNAEGWGLYAEAITLPYMPDEGKLISLQLRLQRAARAFLDPELQMRKWSPKRAREFLEREVGLSPAFATEEVDRFTFRAPGQATSYYYGYLKLLELREAAEKQLGRNFDPLTFHDTILAQGLLPPDLMKKAVLAELRQ
ncbi:MAG: DUF885 domain-containing protein [Deltaproteobacteria bacterium]